MKETTGDLTRTTLAVLFIGALIAASLWIVRPFLPAVIWGAMIVIATWPMMRRVQARLWNSRALAVGVMVTALFLALVLPLSLAVASIIGNADDIAAWAKSLTSFEVPPPPEWLGQLPVVGRAASTAWTNLATIGIGGVASKVSPYAFDATKWLISQAGSIGVMVLHFLLTVIVAGVCYGPGSSDQSRLATGEPSIEIVGYFRHADRSDRLGHRPTLCRQHIHLAKLGHNLLKRAQTQSSSCAPILPALRLQGSRLASSAFQCLIPSSSRCPPRSSACG